MDLPDRSPDERPRAVIIGGQQGAGKTTTQKIVHGELGGSRVALYDGDDNAKSHPHYEEIAREHPSEGHGMAEGYLPDDLHQRCMDHLRAGETKYDVVASHPLGRKDWAESWVKGFSDEGYHTSVAFVATHESNSLLGTADRYQKGRDRQGHGRWAERATHDRTYAEIPNVAHHLESEGLVDSIYVTDRDGGLLYENHRGPDGQMVDPLGARDAIVEERSRPPTQAETDRFESRVAYLRDPERLGPDREAEQVSDRVLSRNDDAERLHEQSREASENQGVRERPDRGLAQSLREQVETGRQQSAERTGPGSPETPKAPEAQGQRAHEPASSPDPEPTHHRSFEGAAASDAPDPEANPKPDPVSSLEPEALDSKLQRIREAREERKSQEAQGDRGEQRESEPERDRGRDESAAGREDPEPER
ncbi:zeta toxin family protein [Nocardiopsis exhalans]|uniref:UDP-N-acetylglucosamine kinase n=1 Tax=Nocardiopsis exhalans TaxID=163604 RepID=A0ABY5DBH6_9ACTN|nr:zeta toxin family protein [Nocardiopsis exhalans]USY21315.1 zeta toxin family protein [Nocardiopsis exhalans]